jgi:hypothetical protein
MTDQLTQAQTIYRDARHVGLNKAAAKRRVDERLPGFRTALANDKSYMASWGRSIQKIEKALAPSTSANGRTNDTTPSPNGANGHTPAAAYSPTDDMLAYLTDLDPAPGDIITLNLHYLTWTHNKANDAAWRYCFADNGSLARLGWKFEVLANNGRCYQVRVLARPQTEQQREIDQLQAQITAIQEQLARLKTHQPVAQQGLF